MLCGLVQRFDNVFRRDQSSTRGERGPVAVGDYAMPLFVVELSVNVVPSTTVRVNRPLAPVSAVTPLIWTTSLSA